MANSITPPRGLNTREAAYYLGISYATLCKIRYQDFLRGAQKRPPSGPRFLKIGTSFLYLRDELDRWLDERMKEFYGEFPE